MGDGRTPLLLVLLMRLWSLCFAYHSDPADGTTGHLKREHTLVKPYQSAGSSERALWDIIGNTMVTSQQVRLTPDQQSKQGAIWNRVPCGLVDWELQVQFKVHGEGRRNLNGDGLALWYTRDQLKLGPVFGNAQNFSGMGIFIDTYYNEGKKTDLQYPYVSVMVNNGTLHYNHERDGRRTSLGGCPIAIRNVKHDTFISIKYAMQQVTIKVDAEGRHYWKDCVEIRNVQLPTGYHFGASATTGDLSDNHDIVAIKVYELSVERSEEERFQDWSNVIPSAELILEPEEDEDAEEKKKHQDEYEEKIWAIKFFCLVFFSMLAVVVLAVGCAVFIIRRQEENRKRLY
uniref:vesicular integral-membrane protein VIP36-like n=1 Tax=Myxine glutinosa TaxID=7769 RepID=UPI00358E3652